jgi:hypothetical protein
VLIVATEDQGAVVGAGEDEGDWAFQLFHRQSQKVVRVPTFRVPTFAVSSVAEILFRL